MHLDGLGTAECAASVLRAQSPRLIGRRARTVRLGMLELAVCVRFVRLALSLMHSARAASGAKLALRAVMVRAPPVLMERRSTM